jgi:hypothetical protein
LLSVIDDKCKTQSICRGHYENLEYITKEGEIIKNLNKGEFYKYLGINQSNHIQHSIIKEYLEKQFYLRIKSILKSKLNGNNLIKAVNTYAVPLLTYSFGIIKWSKTNLQNINIQTRILFTKFCKHHPKSAIERFNLYMYINYMVTSFITRHSVQKTLSASLTGKHTFTDIYNIDGMHFKIKVFIRYFKLV